MARLNVWVPDDLAERAKALGLNVSALTQEAVRAAVERHALDGWLDDVRSDRPVGAGATHDDALRALDAARDELGDTQV